MSTVADSETAAVINLRVRASLERLLYSANAWVFAGLAAGAVDAFNGRHAMNPDGISYVDIAQTALRVGPAGLVNGYWSPGYPALIAATLRLARPTIVNEFPVVHALNFVILAATILIGRSLLSAWAAKPERAADSDSERSPVIPLGFGVFLLIVMVALPAWLVTPDLAVLATTLLIALTHERLKTRGSWMAACALGGACALGYWMKTAMFPLGAAFLLLLVVFPPRIDRPRAKALAAVGVWALLSIPLIGLVSSKLGRLSLGETGRLNYAWYVLHSNDVEAPGQYDPALVHPPRVLLAEPRIIEFGSPIPGTFPLHYDHSYWAEGSHAHFALRPQMRAFAVDGFEYAREFVFEFPVVIAALLGLAAAYVAPQQRKRGIDILLVWSGLWLALYFAVLVESRYVAPAILLIAFSLVRKLVPGQSPRTATGIAAVLAGFVVLQAASLVWLTIRRARDHDSPQYLAIAKGLSDLGLTPTTRIAIVGQRDGYQAAYAHAAGLVVAAEIVRDSVAITNGNVAAVKKALAGAGIRAIVRTRGPLDFAESEWRRIPLGDGSVTGVLFTAP
jgi:hypothetical protein